MKRTHLFPLLVLALFFQHSDLFSQNNLLSVTVLSGDGKPAKDLTVNIHDPFDSLITSVKTDQNGEILFRSNQLLVSLDIRSNDLNYKSAYDRCYLLQNDTTQKIYVLYKRSDEEFKQLRSGLKKLSLTETGNLAKNSCPNFVSGLQNPEKIKELQTCLVGNIHYPEKALEEALEGKIKIRFVVDEHNQIRDLQIIEGSYAILEEEALRAAACLTGIDTATCNGKKVPTIYTLPLSFKLR